jgi:hypothetical protein
MEIGCGIGRVEEWESSKRESEYLDEWRVIGCFVFIQNH